MPKNLPISLPPRPTAHAPPASSSPPPPSGPGDAARREWAQLLSLIRSDQVRTLREANSIIRERHAAKRPNTDADVRTDAEMQRRTRWVASADRSLRDMETVYRAFVELRVSHPCL